MLCVCVCGCICVCCCCRCLARKSQTIRKWVKIHLACTSLPLSVCLSVYCIVLRSTTTTTTMDTIDTTDTTTSRVCYATCNLQLTLTLASAASSSSASALSLSAASPLPPCLVCALEQFIAFIADRRGVPPFSFLSFFLLWLTYFSLEFRVASCGSFV